MKFSLFFEMQLDRPTRASEAQLFHDCLAQAVLADELGYHCVWAVEHHGLLEYSHSSAPEVFLSFVAARTQRIRVGHGVALLPGRYNHPIRVAERVATLDILSGGRVNFGSGKSSSRVEQGAFACDPATLQAEWEEALAMLPRMWQDDVFRHKGRFYDIPPTQIIPHPVQAPHPPLFGACSRPESIVRMGELGLGALNFMLGTDEVLAQKVAEYRQAVVRARPAGRGVTNHFACTPSMLVLEDDALACEVGFRGIRFFVESMTRYYLGGERPLGFLDIHREPWLPEELAQAMAMRNAPGTPVGAVIGDPTRARETVARYAAAGVDELIFVVQMGTVPQALVLASLRTFAEQVMPHFATG